MSVSAMKQAVEALEMYINMDTHDEAHILEVDIAPKAITALRTAIEQAAKQEPVAWVCYGMSSDEKHSIDYEQDDIDALPVGTMLYTTPPVQEFVCSTGFCRFTLTQTNVGIGERGMQAYEEAKKRGWVGISDEMEMPKQEPK